MQANKKRLVKIDTTIIISSTTLEKTIGILINYFISNKKLKIIKLI